jgi:hypothetical protein
MDHGKSTYRNHKCRCDVCLDGHRLEMRDYRRQIRQRPRQLPAGEHHGTVWAYVIRGCRCEVCEVAR